jgi:hypothetical protein
VPIPVAAPIKSVCGRSFAGIVGSNPAEDMDVRLLFVVCCAGSGFCDVLITRLVESYWVCGQEISTVRVFCPNMPVEPQDIKYF